jgi:hypothetical protein
MIKTYNTIIKGGSTYSLKLNFRYFPLTGPAAVAMLPTYEGERRGIFDESSDGDMSGRL